MLYFFCWFSAPFCPLLPGFPCFMVGGRCSLRDRHVPAVALADVATLVLFVSTQSSRRKIWMVAELVALPPFS